MRVLLARLGQWKVALARSAGTHAESVYLQALDVMDSGGSGNVEKVALSDQSACALSIDHEVWCWGLDLTSTDRLVNNVTHLRPERLAGVDAALDLAMGGDGTGCAVLSLGRAKCWGQNTSLQAGTGPLAKNDLRRGVIKPSSVPSTRSRESRRAPVTRARFAKVALTCWGQNDMGQLGLGWPPVGKIPGEVGRPTDVPGITNAADVVVGNRSTSQRHGSMRRLSKPQPFLSIVAAATAAACAPAPAPRPASQPTPSYDASALRVDEGGIDRGHDAILG